jgi:hypothetical protein
MKRSNSQRSSLSWRTCYGGASRLLQLNQALLHKLFVYQGPGRLGLVAQELWTMSAMKKKEQESYTMSVLMLVMPPLQVLHNATGCEWFLGNKILSLCHDSFQNLLLRRSKQWLTLSHTHL